MWARVVEVMIGVWLAMSPFIFHPEINSPRFWWNDFACAVLIMTWSLLSFWRPARRAHLLQIIMGLWLMGWAFAHGFGKDPVPAALQNDVMTGFTLLMFAILPSKGTRPPASWERMLLERQEANREPRGSERTPATPF